VPAQQEGALGPPTGLAAGDDGALVDGGAGAVEGDGAVVGGDEDELVPGPEPGGGGRVDVAGAVLGEDTDERGRAVGVHDLGERPSGERGLVDHVDLVA